MMSLDRAVDRAIDRINLIGDECDVYSILYQYKAIRELPDEEVDKIYDHVVKVLGFQEGVSVWDWLKISRKLL